MVPIPCKNHPMRQPIDAEWISWCPWKGDKTHPHLPGLIVVVAALSLPYWAPTMCQGPCRPIPHSSPDWEFTAFSDIPRSRKGGSVSLGHFAELPHEVRDTCNMEYLILKSYSSCLWNSYLTRCYIIPSGLKIRWCAPQAATFYCCDILSLLLLDQLRILMDSRKKRSCHTSASFQVCRATAEATWLERKFS